jgi:HNH endonuclease
MTFCSAPNGSYVCPRVECGCGALSRVDVSTSSGSQTVMSRGCDHCRFHKYVAIMTTTDCWLWTGAFYSQAHRPTYGQAWFRGKRMGAHRMSYLLHVGPVDDGLEVMHSCDIKACVNPAHLRLGTHQENIREAFAKKPPGRLAGENSPRARLTWAQVRAIRAASAEGRSYADLSRQYGVTAVQIRNIVLRLRWTEPTEAVA